MLLLWSAGKSLANSKKNEIEMVSVYWLIYFIHNNFIAFYLRQSVEIKWIHGDLNDSFSVLLAILWCSAQVCLVVRSCTHTHTLHLTTNKQRQTLRANEANSYNNLVLLQRTKSAILLNGNCQRGRGEKAVIEEWKVENGNGKSDCQRLPDSAGTLALS